MGMDCDSIFEQPVEWFNSGCWLSFSYPNVFAQSKQNFMSNSQVKYGVERNGGISGQLGGQ